MKLIMDVGNSCSKLFLRSETATHTLHLAELTVDSIEGFLRDLGVKYDGGGLKGGAWCSVREVSPQVCGWLQSHNVRRVDFLTPTPLRNLYATPTTLGMDRLCAAVGAWQLAPHNPILVIDTGTAITLDFVTERGEYLGGNISPGVELRFKALHEHTGALPLLAPEVMSGEKLFGNTTESAIMCGVMHGVKNEIEGYIGKLRALYPNLLVYLTGGHAKLFARSLEKMSIFAADNLVIQGLVAIAGYNKWF